MEATVDNAETYDVPATVPGAATSSSEVRTPRGEPRDRTAGGLRHCPGRITRVRSMVTADVWLLTAWARSWAMMATFAASISPSICTTTAAPRGIGRTTAPVTIVCLP